MNVFAYKTYLHVQAYVHMSANTGFYNYNYMIFVDIIPLCPEANTGNCNVNKTDLLRLKSEQQNGQHAES